MLQTQILKGLSFACEVVSPPTRRERSHISPKVKWETSPTQKRRGKYVSLLQHKFIRCKPPWLFVWLKVVCFFTRDQTGESLRMSSTVGAPTTLKRLSSWRKLPHASAGGSFFQHTDWATNKNSDTFHSKMVLWLVAFQTCWKKYMSNLMISPIFGVKINNLWNHHLASMFWISSNFIQGPSRGKNQLFETTTTQVLTFQT